MDRNLVLINRERLKVANYVQKASVGFWGFQESKVNRLRERFGDNFNLIIFLRRDLPFDFYVLPYSIVAPLLSEDTLTPAGEGSTRRRWAGHIGDGKFYLSGNGTIDVSRYYGPSALLLNPDLFDISKLADSAQSLAHTAMLDAEGSIDVEEEEFPEGRLLYRKHRKRERSNSAVKKKKESAAATGELRCEACDFDFFARYGDVGKGFIECHHIRPISEYKDGQKTKLSDLALVCSNCHRMLHRFPTGLSIENFKRRIAGI